MDLLVDRMLQGRIRGILGYGWFVAEDLGDDGGNGVVGEDVRIVERRGQRQGDVVSIGARLGSSLTWVSRWFSRMDAKAWLQACMSGWEKCRRRMQKPRWRISVVFSSMLIDIGCAPESSVEYGVGRGAET